MVPTLRLFDFELSLIRTSLREVVEVGSSVSRFSKGDRVLAHALKLSSKRDSNKTCESAFQAYTVIQNYMASKIPSTMSFEQASVIPLCLSTAACGMYQKGYLALQYPSIDPKPTGKTVLVWGGASSVGSNAIQLGVSSGYEVITTASPKNFEYVKKLGASQVYDYNSKTIVDDLITALENKTCAGAIDCIGQYGSWEACADVLFKSKGAKFVAASRRPPNDMPDGISSKFIIGSSLRDDEVSKIIYEDFLPQALADGKFIAAPNPHVVGYVIFPICQSYFSPILSAVRHFSKGMAAPVIFPSLKSHSTILYPHWTVITDREPIVGKDLSTCRRQSILGRKACPPRR